MRIRIEKFGKVLVSRPAGREALLVMLSAFRPAGGAEPIELDFSDVLSVAPSWLDEVLIGLKKEYGGRVVVLPSPNRSLVESLRVITDAPGPGGNNG